MQSQKNVREHKGSRTFFVAINLLAQDDPQGVDDAGDAADEGGNDVDPEIVVDLAGLHVDGEGRDEEGDDNLQYFVIHCVSPLGWVVENRLILYPVRIEVVDV